LNNSFAGLRKNVRNWGCRQVISELMALRQQLCLRGEWDSSSGWDDPLNLWLADELGRIRKSVAVLTTEKSQADTDLLKKLRELQAADETQTLLERYNGGAPITEDDQLMPSSRVVEHDLSYDFSGADPNVPQIQGRKNGALVSFVTQLDRTVMEITNLDCQGAGTTIPKSQAAMVVSWLDSMFTILQLKGGEANRRTIAQGSTATESKADDVVGTEIAAPADAAK